MTQQLAYKIRKFSQVIEVFSAVYDYLGERS